MSDYAYKKKNTRTFGLMLYKNSCADVIEQLDKQPSKQKYIIDLIRADIEREKNSTSKKAV